MDQGRKTSRYPAARFEAQGYAVRRVDDIPGFPADSDAGRPGPQVVILAEMDWLIDDDGMVPVNDSNRT